MWFSWNETPDSLTLQPIEFASKSLISAEMQYSNVKKGCPMHTLWSKEMLPLFLCLKSKQVNMLTDH